VPAIQRGDRARLAKDRAGPARAVAPCRHSPALPEDLADIPIERFTPTFVLVEDGREIARLRGYPGDQFFWALVDEMLAKLEQ
jgi:hypothetical protein